MLSNASWPITSYTDGLAYMEIHLRLLPPTSVCTTCLPFLPTQLPEPVAASLKRKQVIQSEPRLFLTYY